jgi:hypothetical protein
MSIDEQEVRRRLEAVAAQVSPPRFSLEGLTGRIRRRRARIVAAAAGLFLAVAAAAVVPIGLSAPSPPPRAEAPPAIRFPFKLSFTVAVNGRSMMTPPIGHGGPFPAFAVTPGEKLAINVTVTVPAHATVTAIWLGVAHGLYSAWPGGRPTGLSPILAHSATPLTQGLHVFRLRWTVPVPIRPGTIPWLVAAWTAHDFQIGQFIAELVTGHASPNGSGKGFPHPCPPKCRQPQSRPPVPHRPLP